MTPARDPKQYLEAKSSKRNQEEAWKRKHGRGSMEEEAWKRKQGRGSMKEEA